jgi:membrane fusion protein (multidrug efflux system)
MTRNSNLTALLLVLLAGCSSGPNQPGGKSAAVDDAADTTAATEQIVETLVLEKQLISRTVEYTSSLIPFEENHLVPSSPGRIEKIYVEIGDRVRKGDLLVQMDRTQLHQAEVQLKNVENDFRRLDTLNKVGSISEQQYDQMKTQYDIALSNVKFLRENTVLRAPFAGIISGKYYEDGEFYSGAPSTPTGKAAIVSLVQINPLKVEVNITEKYFPVIRIGMQARVSCDIYPGMSFQGKVMMVHPTIDPATRSFTTEIKIGNEKELLRPGMFSRVTMDFGKEMALVLPSVAVLKLQGSNERYVFVEENGTAKRIIVQIGKRFDDKIEVISDELSAGSHLIVKGQAKLVDRDKVKVVSE